MGFKLPPIEIIDFPGASDESLQELIKKDLDKAEEELNNKKSLKRRERDPNKKAEIEKEISELQEKIKNLTEQFNKYR